MLIAICICTFRRPDRLAATLHAIGCLEFKQSNCPELHVVVADNEGSEATRAVTQAFAAASLALTYAVEPRRGISFARNACLERVPSNADYVAFLDDDVVPRPNWLEELVLALEATGAEAATGPCMPVYSEEVPEWIRAGRFFASPRAKEPENHARIDFGVMGNILFKAAFLRQNAVRFDDRFGLIGGEDRKFYMDLFERGAEFVWARDAVVDHHVSADRLSFAYIVRREFGIGCAAAILKRSETLGPIGLLRYGIQVVGKLALKILLLAPAALIAAVRDNAFRRVKPVLDIANLSGRLYGLSGLKYELYR